MNSIVVRTGKRRALANMTLDEALLSDLVDETKIILHLYEWEKPSATYGYFLNCDDFFDLSAVEKHGLDLAKRPTGGGIIFHTSDLAFSVLVPALHPAFSENPLENYSFVNQQVIRVIQDLFKDSLPTLLPEDCPPQDPISRHFCMAKPTKYDVMIGGRKVGGAAQRKTKHGFLHQGSIFLGMLSDAFLSEVLKEENSVLENMKKNSFPLLGEDWNDSSLSDARMILENQLEKAFSEI